MGFEHERYDVKGCKDVIFVALNCFDFTICLIYGYNM